MQRILVIGSGGAGKSTFARELGGILDLPVVHLDALYWSAGWQKPSPEGWRATVSREIARPRWVMDGNFGGTFPQRLERCDTVVLLDLPRLVCLWRVIKRHARYRGATRPDMAADCPERLEWEFIRWIWNYPSKSRPEKLEQMAATGPDQRVVILSSTREVRRFLDETRREVELRRLSAGLASRG